MAPALQSSAGSPPRTVVVAGLVIALMTAGIGQATPAAAATADKIAPAVAAAGSGIAIAGTGLSTTTAVTLLGGSGPEDDVEATSFVAVSDTKLMVQLPPGAKTGPVAVASAAGTVTTPVPATIAQTPQITELSAQALAPGATLTISGLDLLGIKKTAVTFGQKKASPLPASTSTALQVPVPAGLPGGPVALSVTTDGGSAMEDFWIAPSIKSVVPSSGTTAGGTTVTILGAGFTGVTGHTDDPTTPGVDERLAAVTIGGAPVRKLIAVSDTEIVAVTPPGTDAAARVAVSTRASGVVASSTTPVAFSYQPLPVVTSLSQDWNAIAPGSPQAVTATGVNLTETTRVVVGTLPATDLVADPDAGTLSFTPPAAAKAAASKVTFSNTVGAVSHSAVVPFAYIAAPTLAKLSPTSGPAGTVVTIAGTNFASGTTVAFGGAPAACTVVSITTLRCTAPAGSGASDVTVTNGVGTSSAAPAAVFTYTTGTPAPAPAAPVVQAAVTGVSPTYGTAGTTVALKGTNFHLVTKVEMTGTESAWVNAPQFQAPTPTRLVVTVPSGAGTGPLRVTTPAGRVIAERVVYTAATRPSIASIDVVGEATYGVAANDMVQIKGAGLLVGTIRPVVTIGGKVATVLARPVPTAKTVLVRVPPSVGGRERLTVTTPLGSATAEASLYFTPQIKAVKPISYDRAGGLPFSMTGTGFTGVDRIEDAAGGRLAGVTLGGIPVAKLVVVSDKEIVAVTANGSATADALLVRSQHGSWIGSSDEQVRATNLPVPTVTNVSPNVAVLGLAPTPVTITGTHLRETSTVTFGAAAAVVQSASEDGTSLVVVPPARTTVATVGVTVTNVVLGEELSTTLPSAFRYLPQPSVAAISPDAGFTGVTPPNVTITGTNLRLNSVVRFGNAVAAVATASEDGTSLVVSPPLHNEAGTVDVTITNIVDEEELSATLVGAYTYQLRAYPTVTDISPASAVAGEASAPVTITGTNLYTQSVVRFGSVAGTVQSAAPDGTSLVVVPPTGAAGTVSVTVTNTVAGDDLSVTVANGFRYLPTPSISSVSPDSGTVSVAQQPVTITGSNFLPNSVVRFGGVAGAVGSVTANGTSMTVTPPIVSTPGPVDVTVTNLVGEEQLVATLTSGYTYLDSQSPTITSVSPSTGVTNATNPSVTITGSKLRLDTIVKFGSATATVQSVDATGETMVVVTPPVSTSDGYVAVSVTNVVGGQPLTSALANGYRYIPEPAISSISPATGLTGSAPPTVTITGRNLRLNSVVRFGAAAAVIESAASDGSSIVVSPPSSNTVGAVDVSVSNIVDGTQTLTATSTNGYQYSLAAARVTGMSASTALPGTQVTLTGTSFSGVTAVRFGTASASFVVASPTTVYATVPVTPAAAQGTTSDVTVINGTGQTSTADPATADDWTWASHPFITGMTPTSGVEGTQVTITGTGFSGATAVRFGGIDVTYTVVNDTTVQATVPNTPSAGSVADVVVVARGLTSPEPLTATINDWTWHPIAAITQLNPNPGAAGATITVTGRNFTNVRRVTVNGVDVTSTVVVQSSTSLTFTAPPRPGGGGANRLDKPVYVTNGSNVLSTADTDPATGKPANLFTWL